MGALLKWLINVWLAATGRRYRFAEYPWLQGPMGEAMHIGDTYYQSYAARQGYIIERATDGGLVHDFRAGIPDSDPNKGKLHPAIAAFYEHTALYRLEVWSQWYRPYALFARILISTVSTKMNQLNIPLQPLETSRGMSNEVLHLKDPATGKIIHACWLRKSILTGKVVYSGFYSAIDIDGQKFVRVVFPLPGGNATVLLHAVVQDDGSVKLLSDGRKFGDAGYYRIRKAGEDGVKVRYVPIKEVIHVFMDKFDVLRTDHLFSFLGSKMLHLHYKILTKQDA